MSLNGNGAKHGLTLVLTLLSFITGAVFGGADMRDKVVTTVRSERTEVLKAYCTRDELRDALGRLDSKLGRVGTQVERLKFRAHHWGEEQR